MAGNPDYRPDYDPVALIAIRQKLKHEQQKLYRLSVQVAAAMELDIELDEYTKKRYVQLVNRMHELKLREKALQRIEGRSLLPGIRRLG